MLLTLIGNKKVDRFFNLKFLSAVFSVFIFSATAIAGCAGDETATPSVTGLTPDTGQTSCYNNTTAPIGCPSPGAAFYGQDANYSINSMSYTNNGDGSITDSVTGLMWEQGYHGKWSLDDAEANASSITTGGYSDWRVPSIKELYTLIHFNGVTGQSRTGNTPYINSNYFIVVYGNESIGERFIDSQFLTSTVYVSTTMIGDPTVFGVNFIDGRIKGYPMNSHGPNITGTYYVRYVRGDTYGESSFSDNGNGTVTDNTSGLTWLQGDNVSMGAGTLNWEGALSWCENLSYAGNTDWRLPHAKELQGIVDYTRSPDTTGSAAINSIFTATAFTNEDGATDWGYYWTGTTHLDGATTGDWAVYVAFGRGLGYMNGSYLDVHGAGVQRSDPKSGSASTWAPGHGPQGDVIRIYNMARCVRGG